MKTKAILAGLLAVLGLAGASVLFPPASDAAPAGRLSAFSSDAELAAFLKRVERRPILSMPAPAVAPPPAAAAAAQADSVVVTGSRAVDITNTQEAGVDEGGIVKQRGDILIVLRRGRLFTLSIAGGGRTPIDRIDAYPPGVDASGDWYDEMLLSGDRVIVVGYSYSRGGTEINRFRITDGGRLRYEDSYQLKSNDYYSSRNYASRLIGDTLVFYTPLSLEWRDDPLDALPTMRRWRGRDDDAFRRIIRAPQVYVPPALRDGRDARIDTLHTLTRCDLAAPEMRCTATGVLGAGSRSFYVSPTAMYLWISDAWSEDARRRRGAEGFLYRLPLDRSAPGAIGVAGSPIDQFSFAERGRSLAVLVRADGGGDGMWAPEVSAGAVALARIPLARIGDGSAVLPRAAYRALPSLGPDGYDVSNRFVGDYLLYGAGSDRGRSAAGRLHVVPLDGRPVATLAIDQAIDRIDILGRDAIVVGGTRGGGLGFATIDLTGRAPTLGDRFELPRASESESRSQAFFFSPSTTDGSDGMLGLPVFRDGRWRDGAAILYLARDARRLREAGLLEARPGTRDDGCVASCVDWYGNARPIFTGGRVFALMGYELVEGRASGGRIGEIGRVAFAPPPPRRR